MFEIGKKIKKKAKAKPKKKAPIKARKKVVKKAVSKKPAKKVVRKPAKKTVKKTPVKKVVKKAASKKPVKKAVKTQAPAAIVPEEKPITGQEVGHVSHYYSHIGVAVVEMTGRLKVGDRVRIKGHTTDFEQNIESMQIEHLQLTEAQPGQAIGMRVIDHVREHDVVYRL